MTTRFDRITQQRIEKLERIRALGVQLENGEITGTQYAYARGDIVQEIAARRSEIPPQDYEPKTVEEKALDVYYRKLDDARTASPTKLLNPRTSTRQSRQYSTNWAKKA